jgi:hypothetical protein
MKIGIILTGIIEEYYLDKLIKLYEDFLYTKIVSTWNYIDNKIIEKLKENNFLVIQSDYPANLDKNSVNYQNYSTYVGIEYSKQFGITHVLRMRCDMFCTNTNKYLEICENKYENNKLIFLCYLSHDCGYLIDFGHFGSIDDSLKYINNYKKQDDCRFAEKFRQELCFGTSDFNIIKNKVIFVFEEVMKNNIDFGYMRNYRTKTQLLDIYLHPIFKALF